MAEIKKPVSEEDKLLGALSYISFVSIIMFVLKRDNAYISFHARQGIVLFIASLFWFIPVLGWAVVVIAYVFMVIGFIKAYQGDWFKIPVVHQIAEKFK